MDKLNAKSNAFNAMRAAICCNDSMIAMTITGNKQPESIKKMYKEATELLDIEFNAQLKLVYKNLKELYDG